MVAGDDDAVRLLNGIRRERSFLSLKFKANWEGIALIPSVRVS